MVIESPLNRMLYLGAAAAVQAVSQSLVRLERTALAAEVAPVTGRPQAKTKYIRLSLLAERGLTARDFPAEAA